MIGWRLVVTAIRWELVVTAISWGLVVMASGWVVSGGAVVNAVAAASAVVGRGEEDEAMVSDTRLLRRALLRKYGGEKASRGLAGRRRDGAVLQLRVWGARLTQR